MSDFQMFHALGQQDGESNSAHPSSGRPSLDSIRQSTGSHRQVQGQLNQGTGSSCLQQQSTNLGPPSNGLTHQLSNMSLGSDTANTGVPRISRKKERHAYHNISQPAPQPAYGGDTMPPSQQSTEQSLQSTTNYRFNDYHQPGFSSDQTQPHQQPDLYGAPTSHLPSTANGPFNPIDNKSSIEFAARAGHAPPTPVTPIGAPAGSAQAGRVDPDQIPSVPRSRDIPAQYYLTHIYPTLQNHLPPPASIPFLAHDQGNSSPKFARLTINNIPSNSEILASTGLPLGLLLQPLAPVGSGEQPVPVLDFGDRGPPRCRRCRAYINPFMTFPNGGNKFICNMCTFPNDVPTEYFSPTDPNNRRVDRDQRPELSQGTVEFIVPKEYYTREPSSLHLLFVIDTTQEAVNKGWLSAFCEGIMQALYANENGEGEVEEDDEPSQRLAPDVKIGIATFDKEMHYYNLNSQLEHAQMLVMPDDEEPFVALDTGLFVNPQESRKQISNLLYRIPHLFATIKQPEPALLSVLEAANAALAKTGGKIICSLSALPTWGRGRLFMRDDGTNRSPADARKLFTTEHPGWRKLATGMVANGVGCDLFLAAPSGGYLDIATVGHVAATTGGETFFYPNFQGRRDQPKLAQELCHAVRRETGCQALMKVRCSNGLQVSSYHGNFLQHTFGADLEFGTIDVDKAIGVLFSYDGKLESRLDAHFQSALLYTTASGQRRVRCQNIVASVTESGKEAMRFVDEDAVVALIAKEATSRMVEKPLKDIRGMVTERCIDILAAYRKNFSSGHPPGQLVLPENLKEFGMYMLCLLKSRPLKAGVEPSDRRTHDMRMIRSMGASELSIYLYPRLFALHSLGEQDCFPDEEGHLVVPPTLRASFLRIEDGGAYLMDNGQTPLLWLHARTSPNLVSDLFGPEYGSLASLPPLLSSLPTLDTHLNAQVRNLLQYLATIRGSKALSIQLARQGIDGAEYEFARGLVEDRNGECQSYVDWLVSVHRSVQLELAGQRRKGGEGEGTHDSSNSVTAAFAGLKPPYW